mmetsp:Transcript_77023/g.152840  ORF Transcript_77023/g.152840 Transcript_77023/m.152840 type:complete len:171 (+) Transcript_77023:651-1163(+)
MAQTDSPRRHGNRPRRTLPACCRGLGRPREIICCNSASSRASSLCAAWNAASAAATAATSAAVVRCEEVRTGSFVGSTITESGLAGGNAPKAPCVEAEKEKVAAAGAEENAVEEKEAVVVVVEAVVVNESVAVEEEPGAKEAAAAKAVEKEAVAVASGPTPPSGPAVWVT